MLSTCCKALKAETCQLSPTFWHTEVIMAKEDAQDSDVWSWSGIKHESHCPQDSWRPVTVVYRCQHVSWPIWWYENLLDFRHSMFVFFCLTFSLEYTSLSAARTITNTLHQLRINVHCIQKTYLLGLDCPLCHYISYAPIVDIIMCCNSRTLSQTNSILSKLVWFLSGNN